MIRSVKLSLKFATDKKRRMICALLESYRIAVNFYIKSLWEKPGRLDKETHERYQSPRLISNHKANALYQALQIVVQARNQARIEKKFRICPTHRGAAKFSGKYISIEPSVGSFDLMLKTSTLHKRHQIWIPLKKTKVLNKWLAVPGARLIASSCALKENYVVVYVELPDPVEKSVGDGAIVGLDIGKHKMIADSNGKFYGTDFNPILKKIQRKKFKSKARCRARHERNCYISMVVKNLPWHQWSVVGVEDLKNVNKRKSKKRKKSFRKAMAPWVYRRVLDRIRANAQEGRACLVAVPSAYTSQTCPKCGMESSENRKGEGFQCVRCVYKADSDHVGAQNVLARTLATIGRLKSPVCE